MFESHSMSNLEPIITEHYLCSVEKNDIDTQVYINLAIVISKQKLSLSVLALILNSSSLMTHSAQSSLVTVVNLHLRNRCFFSPLEIEK